MPYLVRTPVLIARKEPFVDWANNLKDGRLDFAPAGRMVTFKLPRREFFAHRQGRTIDLIVDSTRIVRGIVTEPGSTPAREGADLIVRACNRVCEKQIQQKIPRALAALEDMAAKRASE